MREVAALGADNWRSYTAAAPASLRGHAMLYPVTVTQNGRVLPVKLCRGVLHAGSQHYRKHLVDLKSSCMHCGIRMTAPS